MTHTLDFHTFNLGSDVVRGWTPDFFWDSDIHSVFNYLTISLKEDKGDVIVNADLHTLDGSIFDSRRYSLAQDLTYKPDYGMRA